MTEESQSAYEHFLTPKPDALKKAIMTNHPSPIVKDQHTDDERIAAIAPHFEAIMKHLGLDLSHSSLKKSPERVARMYVKEIFSGLRDENFPEINFFESETTSDAARMIFVSTHVYSFCEHHFVPMHGKAFVAYIPKKKLIGLSKIPRIVQFYSRRPQLQERLTEQIADCLQILLGTEDIAVAIHAEHFCVKARGIQDSTSITFTQSLRGAFHKDANTRREFFDSVNINEKKM